jgi:actin-related protein 8
MEPHSVASSVIIIQPGSTHLLIGRATDATPMVIPHAIAYRRLDGRPPPPHPSAALGAAESAALADATRVALDELPRVGLAGLGARALAAAPPDALVEWAWESPSAPVDGGPLPQYVCGRAAVGLAPSAPYELLYPLRRGRFNYAGTGGPGGLGGAAGTRAYSSTELTDALGRIWSHALADVLEIGAEERQSMGVLLLLRDGYERREAAEMLDVLAGLGFGALALHLRSACAALGAGLQSACIVECDEDTVEVRAVTPSRHHDVTRAREHVSTRARQAAGEDARPSCQRDGTSSRSIVTLWRQGTPRHALTDTPASDRTMPRPRRALAAPSPRPRRALAAPSPLSRGVPPSACCLRHRRR